MMGNSERSIDKSDIFPAAPILCAISIVCCLLLIPGFMKTRVFALAFYVWWLILGCTIILINTCVWRGNTRNIPIYSDIVARILSIYTQELYLAILCVNKLIWTISRPAPSVKVYDGRTRMNRIDALLCIGLPTLLLPINAVISPVRYGIAEDFGPGPATSASLDAWLLQFIPMTVITSVSITYNCCSVRNFYNSRRAKQLPTNDANYRNLRRELPDSQVIKYCSLSIISILGMIFGFIWFNIPWIDWALNDPEDQKWYSVVAGWSNWQYRMNVYRQTRKELQAETKVPVLTGFVFSIPAIGIHLFISFGLGSEARKTYLNWLQSLAGLIIRVYSRLGVSSFRRKWGVASRGNDPENFTPFQLDDIRLEELTATWSASGGRPESMPPPYPTTHSPIQDPPKSLSTFNDLTPPTRVHRKDSRPDVAIPSAAMRRGESAGSQRYQD